MSKALNGAPGPAQVARILISVAAVVLVAGVGLILLMNSQISDMSKTLTDKEAQVGSSETIAKRYQTTLDTYNTTAARTKFLETSVSAKSYVPTLLSQLQTLAEQTNLQVMDVHPGAIATAGPPVAGADGKKQPPPPYDTIDIGLDVTGTYRDTMTFLYDLTTFPKIVSVSSVQFHPGSTPQAAGTEPQISTSMHFTAFVFHDAGNQATPSPAPITTVADVGGKIAAGTTEVSKAAAHAASRAIGASEAANARSQVGVGTL